MLATVKTPIVSVTMEELESLRGELLTDVIYEVEERGEYTFAISPDGEGCYWYDTEEEAEESL